ncbi:MAG: polyribonucleotide nucleotidyltransferase [Spirochaetia bacterium]|nr:polyribonucleotide nucleotidyltransferase [Spirochaetia bacterium]
MSVHSEKTIIDGKEISIENGNWAKQAHGSVVFRVGDNIILATVCAEKEAREGQDFFPLTVDYREKLYSVGRIPSGYIKRENRPQDHETLLSRIVDRPIRPLFPAGYYSEVQLLLTVLSSDGKTSLEGHCVTAASAALMASDIPFNGPVAGVVVGRVDGQFIADPSSEDMKNSDLELVVAGTAEAITMIEGGAQELPKEEVLRAIAFAHENIKKKLEFQVSLKNKLGIKTREVKLKLPDPELIKEIRDYAFSKMEIANKNKDKVQRSADVDKVYEDTLSYIIKEKYDEVSEKVLDEIVKDTKEELHNIEADVVRNLIFDEQVRADGRKPDEIRQLSVELDVLPGVHGSAVFTRGQTQSLGVVTLGTANEFQRYEDLSGNHQKQFMLHYNFPPFSTGEVKRAGGGPGRREIGHGNLAERALKYVVPSINDFPYTIRVVSEILESNGSSSMASVCSGALSLMAAGVPLRKPVSGIAMGLIVGDNGKFTVLSDIAGLEDHFGDMDFKVAGTEDGITAFQLDIKVDGISLEVLEAALNQAEKGRMFILDTMVKAIPSARENIAENAPRITTIQIDPDRIGELIGPGGKIIRSISEKSGAEVNVEDTGIVTIASNSAETTDLAIKMVNDIFAEVEVGKKYGGVVKRIADFGAFVEIFPGKDGLLHISKISPDRVNAVRDVLKEGDEVEVIVLGVDRQGRIDLAHKDFTPSARSNDRPPRDGGRDRDRSGGRERRDRGERRPSRN